MGLTAPTTPDTDSPTQRFPEGPLRAGSGFPRQALSCQWGPTAVPFCGGPGRVVLSCSAAMNYSYVNFGILLKKISLQLDHF